MGSLFVGVFLVIVTCINLLQDMLNVHKSAPNQTLPESFIQSLDFYHVGVIIFGFYLISQTNAGAF
ncbi:hypothetical protein U1P98_07565 [Lysinibacillus irui]|uniref:Uncharacterized protein n=1 Tax=Lysinibacillus irui TaxID=2998077 RepID=A0ABU5NJF4_9BACI|nr:hypothetical protein [Lysinibacillus irui]MEA0553773.1 hypothetical protein [Lysinibacillus irui]MEA0976157.1 hypothetical protein [Lysinibacillus irui]MEA1042311.1 hypothetical protein [Lysinibacillus irui]